MVVTSDTATVPPRAVAPPAEALAVVVTATVLLASSSSLPPTLTLVLPPMWVEAVLPTMLTATPASAGRVATLGVPETAVSVTVEVAARVALPVWSVMIWEVPPTFTEAVESAAMVARGDSLVVDAVKSAAASSFTLPPPTAWMVLDSTSMVAEMAPGATTGIRLLVKEAFAPRVTLAPLRVESTTLILELAPEVASRVMSPPLKPLLP